MEGVKVPEIKAVSFGTVINEPAEYVLLLIVTCDPVGVGVEEFELLFLEHETENIIETTIKGIVRSCFFIIKVCFK